MFKSLGLVKKARLENKKPGFRWLGREERGETKARSDRVFLICRTEYSPPPATATPGKERAVTPRRQFESTCSSFKKVVR